MKPSQNMLESDPRSTSFFRNYWWVLLFALICFSLYFREVHKKNIELFAVQTEKKALEERKAVVTEQKDELIEKIHSQSDPAWIEMVLMKELGVVPEGKTKVHFTTKTDE